MKGEHHNWDEEEIPVARSRNYTARGIAGDFVIPRQYIGGFELESGSRVFLRCFQIPRCPQIADTRPVHSPAQVQLLPHRRQEHLPDLSLPAHCTCRAYGRFNLSLWDDVMAEFQPLTEEDVIVVNFGAWYPRYNIHESGWVACLHCIPRLMPVNLASFFLEMNCPQTCRASIRQYSTASGPVADLECPGIPNTVWIACHPLDPLLLSRLDISMPCAGTLGRHGRRTWPS